MNTSSKISARSLLGMLLFGIVVSCDHATTLSPDPTTAIKSTVVLVTTRDISAGEELTVQNCRIADWPVQYLPEGYLTSLREINGRVALGPIASNSVVALNVLGRVVAPIKLASPPENQS